MSGFRPDGNKLTTLLIPSGLQLEYIHMVLLSKAEHLCHIPLHGTHTGYSSSFPLQSPLQSIVPDAYKKDCQVVS